MKPKWKRVGTHGQPPTGEYVHVRQTVGELARVRSVGNEWADSTLYLTDDDLAALLPSPADIEPAPLPEPWQPLDDVPAGRVLVAFKDGTFGIHRNVDTAAMGSYVDAIAWAPLPEHPAPGWRCGEMTEEIHCGDDKALAEFIAAADPPTVLALLDRAEKAEAELVHAERCWTDLGNDVLENAPDWFDGDEDQDGIAVRYVRWLEDRVAELEREGDGRG